MNRRDAVLASLSWGSVCHPLPSLAQGNEIGRPRRDGLIALTAGPDAVVTGLPLASGLKKLGGIEGENLIIDFAHADGTGGCFNFTPASLSKPDSHE